MLRIITPIILVCIAGGLFFLFTDPHYQNIKSLRAQQSEYDDALTKSKDLKEQRNKLIAKINLISPDDSRKLERLLPNNVDNIRLIIDIDNIAMRYGQHVRNVSVSEPAKSAETSSGSKLTVSASTDKVGSVDLSFSTSAKYDDFIRFLQDLEKSVRIVDVRSVLFTTGEGELITFTVKVKTYWLR